MQLEYHFTICEFYIGILVSLQINFNISKGVSGDVYVVWLVVHVNAVSLASVGYINTS